MKMHFEFSMTEVAMFVRIANKYNDVISNVVQTLGGTLPKIDETSNEVPEIFVEKKHFALSATKSTEVYEVDIRISPRVTEEFEFVAETYIELVETICLAAIVFWKTIKGSMRAYERTIQKFVNTITEE